MHKEGRQQSLIEGDGLGKPGWKNNGERRILVKGRGALGGLGFWWSLVLGFKMCSLDI